VDAHCRARRPARSERQWPYLAFLHYLAERAGLVGVIGDLLKPTPAALTWLDMPESARWQALWEAWRASLVQCAVVVQVRSVCPIPCAVLCPVPQKGA